MADATYVMPEDGNGSDAKPEPAQESHTADRRDTVTLEEMNAKLDAILAALGGRGA